MTPAISSGQELVFPVGCPECGETAGLPYLATTSCEDDRIRVKLRCAKCAHEWGFKMPSFLPKRDRRAYSRGH